MFTRKIGANEMREIEFVVLYHFGIFIVFRNPMNGMLHLLILFFYYKM